MFLEVIKRSLVNTAAAVVDLPRSAAAGTKRRHVKLIIPAAGLIGIYVGAFIGMLIFSRRAQPPGWFTLLLAESFLGLVCGFGAMIPVDTYLGKKASHVDLLKVPQYWLVAGLALYAGGWFLEKATPWILPPFVSNIGLYLAGVLAIWVDEPKR